MQGKANNLVSIVPLSTKKPMKKTEEKKTKQKNCMQEIKAWCGEKFRWILSIVVVFLWIGIWCYKEPIFCFLSDDLYKERNTIIIWIAIIFIFFCVGIFTWKKNTLFSRASILIIIAFTGLFLVLFREDIFNFFFFDFKNGAQDNLTKDSNNFITLLLSSLIFLTLWFFRTYDVREQIGQQDFHDALRMLADDKLVSQEIAVLRLIDISEKNKIYDDTIKLAFIKRMKAPYKEAKDMEMDLEKTFKEPNRQIVSIPEGFGNTTEQKKINEFLFQLNKLEIIEKKVVRRSYAQYIFLWFLEKYKNKSLDLKNLDLSFQDFIAKDKNENSIKKYFTEFYKISGANLRASNLSGLDLRKMNLENTDLIKTNLRGADLRGVNFSRAILMKTDLTDANFGDTEKYLEIAKENLKKTYPNMLLPRGAGKNHYNLNEIDLNTLNKETSLSSASIRRASWKSCCPKHRKCEKTRE